MIMNFFLHLEGKMLNKLIKGTQINYFKSFFVNSLFKVRVFRKVHLRIAKSAQVHINGTLNLGST